MPNCSTNDNKFHGKPCPKCGGTLRYGYRYKYNSNKCVACQKMASREWYKKNKALTLARTKAYRDTIKTLKLKTGCVVCGYSRSARSLSYHHVDPDNKKAGIAELIRVVSVPAALEEIKKCVLLCRNCHGELHDGLIEL